MIDILATVARMRGSAQAQLTLPEAAQTAAIAKRRRETLAAHSKLTHTIAMLGEIDGTFV